MAVQLIIQNPKLEKNNIIMILNDIDNRYNYILDYTYLYKLLYDTFNLAMMTTEEEYISICKEKLLENESSSNNNAENTIMFTIYLQVYSSNSQVKKVITNFRYEYSSVADDIYSISFSSIIDNV